ncbi:hypothetical protein JCM1840_004374 [Sporobolomyces johnsonii]
MTRSSTSSTSSSDEPQTPLSPYLAGTPLERIRTRTSSTSSLPSPLPPNCSPCPPPPRSSALPTPRRRPSSSRQPLYSDTFCTLTSTTLTIRHILHRTSLTLPLSSIRSSRPFCTPAERYALLHGGPRRRLTGVRTRGVGWTGITWARDLDRFVDQRWTSAVVLHVDGWVGRVGFSVEDQEAWWRAWEVARKGQAAVNNGLGVGAGKG